MVNCKRYTRYCLNLLLTNIEIKIRSSYRVSGYIRKLIVKYPVILSLVSNFKNKLYERPKPEVSKRKNQDYFIRLKEEIESWKKNNER